MAEILWQGSSWNTRFSYRLRGAIHFQVKSLSILQYFSHIIVITCLPLVQLVVCSIPGRFKPKTYKIGICCFSDKHAALRSMINTHGLVSVSQHHRNLNKHAGLAHSGHRHYNLIKIQLILVRIQLTNCSLGIKQQSITQ